MAINKVTVNGKAEYDQAISDQAALAPPFFLKKDQTKDFAGVLTFTDIAKSVRNSGRTFANGNAGIEEAITFLLKAGYGLDL